MDVICAIYPLFIYYLMLENIHKYLVIGRKFSVGVFFKRIIFHREETSWEELPIEEGGGFPGTI